MNSGHSPYFPPPLSTGKAFATRALRHAANLGLAGELRHGLVADRDLLLRGSRCLGGALGPNPTRRLAFEVVDKTDRVPYP